MRSKAIWKIIKDARRVCINDDFCWGKNVNKRKWDESNFFTCFWENKENKNWERMNQQCDKSFTMQKRQKDNFSLSLLSCIFTDTKSSLVCVNYCRARRLNFPLMNFFYIYTVPQLRFFFHYTCSLRENALQYIHSSSIHYCFSVRVEWSNYFFSKIKLKKKKVVSDKKDFFFGWLKCRLFHCVLFVSNFFFIPRGENLKNLS